MCGVVVEYLAGGGFVRRLQLLGQLTGAVARCGKQEEETHSEGRALGGFRLQ